jgi:translocator protein
MTAAKSFNPTIVNPKRLSHISRGIIMLASFGVSFTAAGIGSFLTNQGMESWYGELIKPSWTPPGSFIGIVWTLLFTLMSIAAGLIALIPWKQPNVKRALVLYIGQLILNVGWSFCFFFLQSPFLAFCEIFILMFFIALTIKAFSPISQIASRLMIPYILWVSFAAVLNANIAYLNA